VIFVPTNQTHPKEKHTINKCKCIAFPLIASGTFGFPKDKVLKIAVDEISNFLFDNEMLVYIVAYD
jgi:O-acetyl-ADP-ribose deacetylase (regulator of RNase III)